MPADTDVVVCQEVLADRAAKSAPNAQLVTIRNFLQDEAIDGCMTNWQRVREKVLRQIKKLRRKRSR